MPAGPLRFLVERDGVRLDRLVADATGLGRRSVREWLQQGRVRVDGRRAGAAEIPAAGSEIVVDVEAAAPPPVPRMATAPRALFEDERVLVLAKPAGWHCERGRSGGSVADFLEARYGDRSSIGERRAEGGLVHRLDRDTSGVLVAAKTRAAYLELRDAFRSGRTHKWYLALAAGELARAACIATPLARRASRMVPAGRHDRAVAAETRVEPLEGGCGWTLVLASMRSGVMHQVRVHLASVGCPLFGDPLYGGPPLEGSQRGGHLLHALRVQATGLDVTSAVPEDFLLACALLRRRGVTSSFSPLGEA